MTTQQIVSFLHKIQCNQISIGRKGWVRATCPLAFNRHSKGTDRHPSFGMGPGRRGIHCFCFTCKYSGTPAELISELQKRRSLLSDQAQTLLQEVQTPTRLSDRKIAEYGFKEPQKVAGIVVPGQWALELQSRHEPSAKSIPEEHLKPFVLSRKALTYLKDRGLSEKTIREWGLGWHERAQRIVIPIRDTENRLVGISGRAFHSYMKPKFLHSAGFHRDLYLFGEDRIGKNKGATGYLVEGFFDVFLLWQWGYRYPVAMLGSYLSAFQVEKLVNFFDEVVIVPDGDTAGYEAAYRAYGQLHHRIRARIVSVPEGLDPDQLDPVQREKLLGVPSG